VSLNLADAESLTPPVVSKLIPEYVGFDTVAEAIRVVEPTNSVDTAGVGGDSTTALA
jgi:hypothetical protein